MGQLETISIIGHGQSPLGKKWGSRIDEYPAMRLKNPSWQNPEDYGIRCDYMAASTETMLLMLDHYKKPKQYFAQPKRGHWAKTTEQNFRSRTDIPLTIPLQTFLTWNGIFKSLTDKAPNFSIGVFGIICACEFLRAKKVRLVGFDNLMNPDLMDYMKADRGKWVSHHDWHAEKRMLPLIEKDYGVAIRGFDALA